MRGLKWVEKWGSGLLVRITHNAAWLMSKECDNRTSLVTLKVMLVTSWSVAGEEGGELQ